MAKFLAFADIHINSSKYLEYEEEKLRLILKAILSHPEIDHLVLAGDIFDKAKPTLQDIKLFYDFIHKLPEHHIDIIGGNHDPQTFKYLPHTNFTYYHETTTVGDITFIPWAQVHEELPPSPICISHARCSIPPHITEEVDISKFAGTYELTILGDIHSPVAPYENVVYTSSPVPIHFRALKKDSTGYLEVDISTRSYTRHYINGLAKIKIMTTAFKLGDTVKALKKAPGYNLYKVVVEDYPEKLLNIQRYATNSIKIEPKIIIDNSDVTDKVAKVLDQSVEIEDILYDYLRKNYRNFSVDLENKLKAVL